MSDLFNRRHSGLTLRLFAIVLVAVAAVVQPAAVRAQAALPTVTPVPTLPATTVATVGTTGQTYVPGQLLVGMKSAAASAAVASAQAGITQSFQAASAMGVSVLNTIDLSTANQDLTVVVVSTLPGQEYAAAAVIAQEPGVVYVEPNFYAYAAGDATAGPAQDSSAVETPDETAAAVSHIEKPFPVDDPLYKQYQWNMQRVNAARAWQLALDTAEFPDPSDEIVVGVIDSGIDTTQPDFGDRILTGTNWYDDEGRYPGDEHYAGPGAMTDTCGHGTHVAGIIAAGLNDAIGVAGAAPMVRIDPQRVLIQMNNGCVGYYSVIASGIKTAADNGDDILNMSLQSSADSETLRAAVDYAASKGVLMIAAAGNNTQGTSPVAYPAKYDSVMAVAALDLDDQRASYSNVGAELDLAAPGGGLNANNVLSTWSSDAVNLCGSAGGLITMGPSNAPYYYCGESGTSQAAPLVAGTAALLKALNPSLTASELWEILVNTVSPLTESPQYVGAGKLNAVGAVRTLLATQMVVTPDSYVTQIISSTTPVTFTVRLDNPSLTAINYTATLTSTAVRDESTPEPSAAVEEGAREGATIPPGIPPEVAPVVELVSGVDDTQSGQIAFGSPGFLNVRITPVAGWSGMVSATIRIDGVDASGVSTQHTIVLPVSINQPVERLYIPAAFENAMRGPSAAAADASAWLKPADEASRATYALTDTSSTVVGLPISFPLGGVTYNSVRLYSDGFLVLPDDAEATATWPFDPAVNGCLPDAAYPPQGIFGWWANLDPGAGSSTTRVSSFPVSTDRYVFEFLDVPANGEDYTVSFQMVLRNNGNVTFNYKDTPSFIGPPGKVTIGVEGTDARFFNEVTCSTADAIYGWLPKNGQVMTITANDIF